MAQQHSEGKVASKRIVKEQKLKEEKEKKKESHKEKPKGHENSDRNSTSS
jgi:hypothetical protein